MRISDWISDVCSSDLLDLEKAGSGHGRRHRDEADRGEGDAGDRQSPGKLAERQQPGVMPLPFPKPIEAEERKPEEQSQIAIKREARPNDEPVIHVSAHRDGQMEIGRTAVRERVVQNVWNPGVAE